MNRINYLNVARVWVEADMEIARRLDEIITTARNAIIALPQQMVLWPTSHYDRDDTMKALDDLLPDAGFHEKLYAAAEELALWRELEGAL